jgi:hypothetical protein
MEVFIGLLLSWASSLTDFVVTVGFLDLYSAGTAANFSDKV